MDIKFNNETLQITEYFDLNVSNRNQENVFYCKSNRTLLEMLNNEKYAKLTLEFSNDLISYGHWSIGSYLKYLKERGDEKYLKFLNKNGDKKYCQFNVSAASENQKGLYFYKIADEIKYVGRCLTNFNDRINNNYGKITPTNCFKTGQSTNCHLNSKINELDYLTIGFYVMDNDEDIKLLEKLILQSNPNKFEWNVQRN